MICCLFPGGMIISSSESLSLPFNEVILSAILDPATSIAAGIILSVNFLVASFFNF